MERITQQKDVDKGLEQLLVQCPSLVPIAEKAGQLPLRLQEPGFAGLARIIIGQQVSTASAAAIHERFKQKISPVTPENFLKVGEPAWIEIGLSRAKQAALSNLAAQMVGGDLDLTKLANIPADEAIETLISLKGIGPWTAEVYLLFCAGHGDIFPAGDLALQEAIRIAKKLDERPTQKGVREIASEWAPFRGIAARLFWAYYKGVREGRESLPI